jgi:hypothetical protein
MQSLELRLERIEHIAPEPGWDRTRLIPPEAGLKLAANGVYARTSLVFAIRAGDIPEWCGSGDASGGVRSKTP